MKVALVHDYLNQYGGGERVLEELLALFPDADLYTLLYDKERTYGRFAGRAVHTSFLDMPFVRRLHRPFIPLMPFAVRSLRLGSEYDLVISDSAGFAKGVRHDPRTFHLSYCHTPLRYAWERKTYFESFFFRHLAAPAFGALRAWDARAGKRPDVLLANSAYVSGKVRRYYGRDADVVHPPVNTETFSYDPAAAPSDYFFMVGRLLPYKKVDLVIQAFAGLKLPLVVAGTGPELKKLQVKSQKSKVNVSFLEFVRSDAELRDRYRRARALIFPQVEDFGLVAAEAIACGTPVVAFRSGGACEIVREGESGVFFDEQTPAGIAAAVRKFGGIRFDRRAIARGAERFSRDAFRAGILEHLPPELRP